MSLSIRAGEGPDRDGGILGRALRAANVRVVVACSALTIVILSTPALEFAVHAPRMVAVSETVTAGTSLLVSVLFLARFRASGRRADMLLTTGFATVGAVELVCAVLPDILTADPDVLGYSTWGRTWGGMAVTVGLCAAAVTDERALTKMSSAVAPLVLRTAVLTTTIMGAVFALYAWLPDIALRGAPTPNGGGPVLADRFAVSGRLMSAIALAGAAWAFDRRWRRGGEDLMRWLSVAAILAAVARLHAFMYPVAGQTELTTSHLFRVASNLVLAVVVTAEILRHWEERAARAVLEERRRIAHDLHQGMGNLAFITAQSRWLRNRESVPDGALGDLAEAAEAALGEARRAIQNLRDHSASGPESEAALDADQAATAAVEAVADVATELADVIDLDVAGLEAELVHAGHER